MWVANPADYAPASQFQIATAKLAEVARLLDTLTESFAQAV